MVGSKVFIVYTILIASQHRTMDGNILRESLPEFPLCKLLIFKNGLFEESWLHNETTKGSLVLMTMGPSTGIVYDLSSEKKVGSIVDVD